LCRVPELTAGCESRPPKDGAAAYERSDNAARLRPLAKQGDASAQYKLGLMYAEGRGVPQDYLQAHKWFNLSAARSLAKRNVAVSMRELVAILTPAQIAEAQKLAREWKPKRGDDR